MDRNQQICVLVLGMHRTGTSTIAGILNILGVDLGNRLLIASRDNPKGYFEHSDIVTLNKAFLNLHNLDDDGLLGELPTDWLYDDRTKDFKEKIKSLILRDFGDSEIFGLKDPRISILLPAYLEVFKELGIDLRVIIANRSIQDVINSLHKRGVVSLFDSVIAYKYYYRIIKAYAESLYHIHVHYDDLINDSKNLINKMTDFINHPKIKTYDQVEYEINRFIEPSLRHNKVSSDDFIFNLASAIKDLESENLDIKNTRSQDLVILSENSKLLEHKISLINDLSSQKDLILKENSDLVNELLEEKGSLTREVSILKDRTHDQYEHINYLDSLLQDRDAHILELNSKLSNIERSTVWKIVKGWDFALSLFFPKGSVIRNWYENVINYIQNLLNDIIPHYGVKFIKKTQGESLEYSEVFWNQFKERKPVTDILFVNHEESRTGAPRIVFDVAEHIKHDYEVSMVSLARGSMSAEFNDVFGPVIYPSELYAGLQKIDQAKKVLKMINPKLVYVNSIGSHPFAIAAKELNIPVIFHVHELEIAINMMFKSLSSREKFKDMADNFIAVSSPVYNVLVRNLNCPIEKVSLVHEFVDKEKIENKSELISQENVNKEMGREEGEILVFCLGTFIYRKGADIFMKASKSLKEKGLNCRFVWIGSKPFKEPFMADFGLYSPYFTLLQEKVNPFPYLKAADILVLPSREDPFPLVVLESMSLGKPSVLFKDGGGIYEAVKDSGIVVDDFNVREFTNSIERLVLDREERERLGEKAKIYQDEYDSKNVLPKIKNLIDNLIHKHESRE